MQAFVADVVLKDGSLIHVREFRLEDRQLLAGFLRSLPSDTLSLRFARAITPEAALEEMASFLQQRAEGM